NKIQKMQDKMQVVADELGEDVTFSPTEIINKPSGDIASFNTRTRKLDNQGEVQDILQPKAIPVPEDKIITETLEGFNNASLQDLQRAKQNLQNVGYGNSSLGNQATATSKKAAKQLDTMIKENIPENVKDRKSVV